jgi:hypothetical protein
VRLRVVFRITRAVGGVLGATVAAIIVPPSRHSPDQTIRITSREAPPERRHRVQNRVKGPQRAGGLAIPHLQPPVLRCNHRNNRKARHRDHKYIHRPKQRTESSTSRVTQTSHPIAYHCTIDNAAHRVIYRIMYQIHLLTKQYRPSPPDASRGCPFPGS